MTRCEILPRRNSCQILGFKKKRFQILNYQEKEKKKKSKFLCISFSLFNPYLEKTQIYHSLSIPFGFRIFLRRTCLITKYEWDSKKKKILKKVTSKKIGKMLSRFKLESKTRSFLLRKDASEKFFYLFEGSFSKIPNQKLAKIFSRCDQPKLYFTIKRDFLLSLIISFSSFSAKINLGAFLSIKISLENCFKKNLNNIFQIFGNLLDLIPGGYFNTERIFLKYPNSNSFKIFSFQKNY